MDLVGAVQGLIGAPATALKNAFAGFIAGDDITRREAFRGGVLRVGVIDIIPCAIREGLIGQRVLSLRDAHLTAVHTPMQGTLKGRFTAIIPEAPVGPV